jgi:hypothetical protein
MAVESWWDVARFMLAAQLGGEQARHRQVTGNLRSR